MTAGRTVDPGPTLVAAVRQRNVPVHPLRCRSSLSPAGTSSPFTGIARQWDNLRCFQLVDRQWIHLQQARDSSWCGFSLPP